MLRAIAAACGAALLAGAAIYFHLSHPDLPVIRSDGRGYYAYLRLYFIDHRVDFAQLSGAADISEMLLRSPRTGKVVNMYPVGTALAELPFFLLGHAAAVAGGFPRDGISRPYQWSIALAGLIWLALGIVATGRALVRRFGPNAALFTLAALVFGTNLLHYVLVEPSMSHVFAFAAVGIMLWMSDRFWEAPSARRSIALGAAIGFLISIRSYDLLLAPMALYPALSRRAVAKRFAAPLLAGTLAALLPQLAVATYYLGAPWASTYIDATFFWTRPQLFQVLLGLRRGWWFWTPLSALAVAGLIVGLRSPMRGFCLAALGSIAATIYLVAAWVGWAMGASFGHRAFVDCLPALGIGLGLLLRRRWVPAVVCVLVAFNLFLTWSYWRGQINERGSTPRAYWRLLKTPFYRLAGFTPNDSTQPRGLAAEVTVIQTALTSGGLQVTARIRNTGSAVWLSDGSSGQVYVDLRGFDAADCSGIADWEWREPIDADVVPGQQAVLTANVPYRFLHHPFRYVCTEMVGVVWFRDIGPSRPAVTAVDGSAYLPFR